MNIAPLLSQIGYTCIGVLGITFLIAFHEFGHFIFCKLFKIDTPSFSIGFGPYLFSKKIGKTVFAISAFPLGGYVEIAGNEEVGQGDQKDAQRTDAHSFGAKPYYQKFMVIIGGILFNLIFAYVAIIGVLTLGAPQSPLLQSRTNIIESLHPNSPAERAGLQPNDMITSLDDVAIVPATDNLAQQIQQRAGHTIRLGITRNDENLFHEIELIDEDGNPASMLGIYTKQEALPPVPFFDAIGKGITLTNSIIGKTVEGFIQLLTPGSGKKAGLSGPVGIIALTTKSAAIGLSAFLLFLAIISVNLAILNLLPIPILDGSQILLITIEAAMRRPLSHKAREFIKNAQYITALLLVVLVLYLTYNDISAIVSKCKS